MQQVSRPKYKHIDRQQGLFLEMRPDELIDLHHPARMIWQLTSTLDLSTFESDIRSREGEAGSPCWPPQLLLSVWLYAYQQGVASARELERRMHWEPGLRWLCGLEIINVHTLCDFRLAQTEKLETLLAQLLTVLAGEGLVDFTTVLQDGTKIQARAGKGSAHRRPALEKKLSAARHYIEQLDHAAHEEGQPGRTRRQAARERAARERIERLEAALEEMKRQEQAASGPEQKKRVSETEPEARRMRHTEDGGWRHSYNVQVSTEPSHNFIVGVSVTQDQNDTQQLAPALATVRRFTRHTPERIIADGGYVTRESVQKMADAGVALIAPLPQEGARLASAFRQHGIAPAFHRSQFRTDHEGLRCPAEQKLPLTGQKKHHGVPVKIYQAEAATCARCPQKPQCCPQAASRGRRIEQPVESEAMQQHAARLKTEPAQQFYRLRSRVAEFAHMRLKGNWRLRRFSVRGLAKAAQEALWMALAFNFSQWIWTRRQAPVAA